MDMLEIKQKIDELVTNLHKIPDEFWITTETGTQAIWLLDQEDGTAGSYETSQERIGITKDGQFIWGFSSGCSCWSGWETKDYCPTKSYREFNIEQDFVNVRSAQTYEWQTKPADWEKPFLNTLESLLFVISENPNPQDVLKLENAEVRRYMIKRIGYEQIKDSVQAEVLHTDGDSELLRFNTGEMYVKVKDSSTDREYLLYVEGLHTTCKSAIAWTFGLTEEQYNPIIET